MQNRVWSLAKRAISGLSSESDGLFAYALSHHGGVSLACELKVAAQEANNQNPFVAVELFR